MLFVPFDLSDIQRTLVAIVVYGEMMKFFGTYLQACAIPALGSASGPAEFIIDSAVFHKAESISGRFVMWKRRILLKSK